MTLVPHTIGVEQSLQDARQLMLELEVRHLPVVEEQKAVGVISDRDISVVQALGLDLKGTSVGIAMTAGPYVVTPETELTRVAREMARQKVGSALVQDGERIVGILTTTDALSLLADAVSGHPLPEGRFPQHVRERILNEHRVIEGILEYVEDLAERTLRDELDVESELFARARELYDTLLRHMELEDALLAPALAELPLLGKHHARQLLDKHREQREQLQMGRAMLASGDGEHLAASILLLAHWLRLDMREEEDALLSRCALPDSLAQENVSAG